MSFIEPVISPAAPLRLADDTPPVRRDFLISPRLDSLLIGGASLILLVWLSLTTAPEDPSPAVFTLVYNLSFAFNFPHFLASYQLLYSDFGHQIFRRPRYFWAGVVAPVLLLGVVTAGFAWGNVKLLGGLATALYFFVAWHYVKQTFGGVVVMNALKGVYYSRAERLLLKTNLFSLWAIFFLRMEVMAGTFEQDGIPHDSLALPEWTLFAAYGLMAVSLAAVVIAHLRKYVRQGVVPAPAALVCFATIYAWYVPLFEHPRFALLIPLFHSLQYMLFVYAFRRNKVDAQIARPQTPAGRIAKLAGLYGYLCIPFFTGAFFMYILPRHLDSLHLLDANLFGPTPAYFAFTVFINLHHYFIDNVMWRGDNEEMRHYLFRS